jgi:replicative DNA helicase
MEMSEEELVAKLLSNVASIDSNAIEQGMVNGIDVPGLQRAGDELMRLPITFYCEGRVKPSSLKSRVRYHAAKGKIGLVVADYIQLMDGGKQGTREREISFVTNNLKAIAMDLKVPILGLAQLNREVAKSGGPPSLIHLRESGALEQDANKVILNYFPDREIGDGKSKYEPIENMQFIVAKNRGGALNTVNAIADKRYSQFKEPEIHVPTFDNNPF